MLTPKLAGSILMTYAANPDVAYKHPGEAISAAMTGVIQCGELRRFFACEDCQDLVGQ